MASKNLGDHLEAYTLFAASWNSTPSWSFLPPVADSNSVIDGDQNRPLYGAIFFPLRLRKQLPPPNRCLRTQRTELCPTQERIRGVRNAGLSILYLNLRVLRSHMRPIECNRCRRSLREPGVGFASAAFAWLPVTCSHPRRGSKYCA